jgi:hypothetical protein
MSYWQIADCFSQLAYIRLFWAVQEPETYGAWLADVPE